MQFKQVALPAEGGLSSNQFIKLNDKESVRGVFRGNPFDFKQHFIKAETRSYNCAGQNCAWCAQGDKAKFRFRVNFITKDPSGAYVAKMFEQGLKFYNTLKTLQESGYNLEKSVMIVTRNGKGTDTTYTVLPVPGPTGTVNDIQEKALSSVKLHDLSNFNKTEQGSGQAPADAFALDDSDDLPF